MTRTLLRGPVRKGADMSDIMRPVPFAKLMHWILSEYIRDGKIFGVTPYTGYSKKDGAPLPPASAGAEQNGQPEAPFGPAAGPHTQLAQNIIAAYAAGARFFELKTVQVMDGEELSACINKPCIIAYDEGYNCEWSTELTVPQALDEYVKAWFACKLLAVEYGLGAPDGFVFNMSVGYDLKGIQSEKIDRFIEGMKDASSLAVWKECTDWTLTHLSSFQNIDEAYVRAVSPAVSSSITESTLHGCPPEEIERIATYLMREKGLHTYVKCNPTLLGYAFARERLDRLGYDYIAFDDHHFREDLQWEDAVPMLQRLQALGNEKGLAFGVKLTNTFPVDVTAGELPSEEMYMSGRALYVLTVEVAKRIAMAFDGALPVSFSGGADALNILPLLEAGIRPVTMATTLLKPGGYDRFTQIAALYEDLSVRRLDVSAVASLSDSAENDPYYRKPFKPLPDRKMKKQLPLLDCFAAPCSDGCPIGQDIPAYLAAVDDGDYAKALQIILERNPLPFITGTICPHTCGNKCMRNHYESAVDIRGAKLTAAENAFETVSRLPRRTMIPLRSDFAGHVAVIGGGPAGIAAAAFLTRAGVPVTIFEKTDALGGVVRHVIPDFRIAAEAIDNDIALSLPEIISASANDSDDSANVQLKFNTEITDPASLLSDGYTDVIIATGAWAHGTSPLEYGDAVNSLDFLREIKQSDTGVNAPAASAQELSSGAPGECMPSAERLVRHGAETTGSAECLAKSERSGCIPHRGSRFTASLEGRNLKHLAVIGGGNTAMDCARAAKRIPGVEEVSIVYRRTKRYMPADEEELQMALADGVVFRELLAPVGVKDGMLECKVMKLGEPDASGRRAPEDSGERTDVKADLVILAVGEQIDPSLYKAAGCALDDRNRPVLDENLQTTVPHIYAAGDCKAGPATVVKAIADAQRVSRALSGIAFDRFADANIANESVEPSLRARHGIIVGRESLDTDTGCLGCATVCETCAEVCPNRANIALRVDGFPRTQILHIDGMCNECGNCAVFCPYDARPYKEKFTLFWSKEDFDHSENEGFLMLPEERMLLRLDGEVQEIDMAHRNNDLPEEILGLIRTVRRDYTYIM